MELTPQETKMIERLRRQEARWPRDRWIFLFGAVFLLAAYGYILARVLTFFQSSTALRPDDWAALLVLAVFWPKCLLGFCAGGWLLGKVIRDWHGNANRMLLLRLLEERRV